MGEQLTIWGKFAECTSFWGKCAEHPNIGGEIDRTEQHLGATGQNSFADYISNRK